jgi:hypothetical protein
MTDSEKQYLQLKTQAVPAVIVGPVHKSFFANPLSGFNIRVSV